MSQPEVERTLSGFQFTWPDLSLAIDLIRIRESSKGIQAELIAKQVQPSGKDKILTHQTCNLLTSKSRLATELGKRHAAPWESMLEQVCVTSLRDLRKGEPVQPLDPVEGDDRPSSFILNPLLYEEEPTVLFGPGDSLKSFFVLYCAMLLANGGNGPHLYCSPEPRRVLWLDWEMSKRNVAGRVRMIQRGHPSLTKTPDFRRMIHALADCADEIKALISEYGYEVICIDSLGMAAGARELEKADSPIAFFAALRGLGLPTIIIGHTPKDREGQGRSIYGNVYFRNLARVSWEVRREGDLIGLYQDKNNLGSKHDPLGFSMRMDGESCHITEGDLFAEPELASHLPLLEQIAKYLRDNPGKTPAEISEALGAKRSSVNSKIHAYKSRFVPVGDGRYECLQ